MHCVPEDQITGLTEEQLGEEFTKALNANNPKALSNVVNFSFGEGHFQLESTVDQVAVHFAMDE